MRSSKLLNQMLRIVEDNLLERMEEQELRLFSS